MTAATRADRARADGARFDAVRRNTRLLALSQGFVQVAFPVMLVVGGVAAADITGRHGATGVVWALYFTSGAFGAFVFGRLMDRVGRRPGLIASYGLLAIAGVSCAGAVAARSYPALLAASIPFGVAFGGSQLVRAAVADMYEPRARARAVGIVLAAGTVGAVGSPLLVAAIRTVAEGRGWDPNVLPWVLVPTGALAAIAFVLAVRPDPRDLSPALDSGVGPVDAPARGPRELLGVPAFRIALLAASIGQLGMVGVMGVTPNALDAHGHGATTISWIISVHIAGMFAFSPWIGAAMDRYGRRAGLLAGGAAMLTGDLFAAVDTVPWSVGVGLFLIGIGWSSMFLGATAIISDVTEAHERAGALGFTDLFSSAASATAGLAGALVLEAAGYRTLALSVAALVLVVSVAIAVGLAPRAAGRIAPEA
ncbi:MAG TPA: MFS transporter [Actinomycetota bacterium]|nr:MFS transporter [Actinomycetota bacterium]